MKAERLRFNIPSIGSVEFEGLEFSTEELKELLDTAKKLQEGEVEKARIYSAERMAEAAARLQTAPAPST